MSAELLAGAVFAFVAVLVWWLGRPLPRTPVTLAPFEDEEADPMAGVVSLWLRLKRHYPFLEKPQISALTPDAALRGIVDTLFDPWPYGFDTDIGLPAPALPPGERRRHLWVVGKTGSGKSTFLERLIDEDMTSGRGVIVMSPEGEFFRDRLLACVPEARRDDVIYLAPGNPRSTVTLNPLVCEPGDNHLTRADDLFEILRQCLGGDEFGPRMRPILQNALGALMGRPGATLWDITRLLEDRSFRERIVADADPYIKTYFSATYPKLARGAAQPVIYRLDRFLRAPVVRRTICNPDRGLSIRHALAEKRIIFIDLFGLPKDQRLLLGLLILSQIRLELLTRELSGSRSGHVSLYCDEFQSFAGMSVSLWRSLLSRGRKYGLALTLANQYPGQLPADLRSEILGNVNSLVAFVLGAADAAHLSRELLREVETKDGRALRPVETAALVKQRVGHAVVKLGGGDAISVRLNAPLALDGDDTLELMEQSWERFGSPPSEEPTPTSPPAPPPEPAPPPPEPDEALEEESEVEEVKTQPKRESPPLDRDEGEETPVEPPGRGGIEHRYLQALIKGWGEDLGYKATVEAQVEDGFVDVLLERGEERVACEVAVSSRRSHEVANIEKCLAAGATSVLVVSRRISLLQALEAEIPADARDRVHLFVPDEVYPFLEGDVGDEGEPEDDATVIAGYRVTTRSEVGDVLDAQARKRAVAQVMRSVLSRRDE